jgi:hypothetical protein
MRPRRAAVAAAAIALPGYAALQWLGRSYGATTVERRSALPGDELCRHPDAVTTHATTIQAPPQRVWPWLVQMGWGRGQWYTARWVDRLLFPANGPSADRIIPELQHLAVGDRILDGPPEANCAFVVATLDPYRDLVLHSSQHLPPRWADRFGATIDFSWAFHLHDVGDGRTRFVFRSRMRAAPGWVRAVYLAAILPADFVMSRQMLRGVKTRAEATTAADHPAITAGAQPSASHAVAPTHGAQEALNARSPPGPACQRGYRARIAQVACHIGCCTQTC